jgi:hypothetical protein
MIFFTESSKVAHNVLQAKVGGPIEASTYFTYKRLFEDTYFISEPQIKFPEGTAVLRANDDRFRPMAPDGWLGVVCRTQIRFATCPHINGTA